MKKKIAFTVALTLAAFTTLSAQSHQTQNSEFSMLTAEKLTWKKMEHNFGTLKKNVPATYVFEFTNTSKEDVLLTEVKGSCGCTTTDYTKEIVKPGKSGRVVATFNAAKVGDFTKTVTVTTQEGNPIILTIVGTVKE